MQKIRVAVIRGGPSEEYDISMETGKAVLDALDASRFDPLDVVITKKGEWLTRGYAKFPEQILSHIDVAFIALHGAYGEDGQLQRLLERHNIPYTGSDSFSSKVAFHKPLTKDTLRDHDVLMAPHMVVSKSALSNVHGVADSIAGMFGPEYVIKPIASGSSVGTAMVQNPVLLASALKDALEIYDQVIVEKRIIGKETTCGVLERFRDQSLYALPPVEIVPPEAAGFFDREVKYNGATREICPANFHHDEKAEIERVAKLVHEVMGLSQYSRSDFILAPETEYQNAGLYFLEVNTLPGFTSESLFPKSVVAVGGTFEQLIDHLLTDALER